MARLRRALHAGWLALLLGWPGLGMHLAWGDTITPAMLLAEVYVLQNADSLPTQPRAESVASDVDVTQYWVSEKFDGVRAQWDGHTLRFRGGGIVPAPTWFTENFPAVPLDGELWMGRGQFDALSGTVRRIDPPDAEWRQVCYLIFELPGAAGSFSERVLHMQALVAQAAVPWLQVIEQTRVASHTALKKQLDATVRAGGEGLMLHRADALYVTGRSDVLLKLKPWQDAEAVVMGYAPGNGKYRGMSGSLKMEMPDGKRFRIGSGLTDALRRQPPPIGTRITYRYQNLTKNGLPRFPRYLRIREDF